MPYPYHIKEGYVIRANNSPDLEEYITDDYQNEVYLTGLELVNEYGLKSVLDVGTGRAFKLMKYFKDLNTLGLDMPDTVNWLKSSEGYPDKKWDVIPLDKSAPKGYDLIICADVIEHVVNPDVICDFICRAIPKYAVISTPDRDLLRYRNCDDGPPFNKCHVREWSFNEFDSYMREQFPDKIFKHWYSNKDQVCQAVIVRF